MGALNGVKVLELSHYIAGPHCGQILADHGADVIKVEPIEGEYSRQGNPMYKGKSLYFPTMNRNKRGLAVNLKSSEGKKIIYQLVKKSDVLLTNYATGVPERLGFDYETISEINPKIIMTHITGFGLTGPYKNKSAFDGIVQSMSGIAHLTGPSSGPPMKAGLFIADHIAALQGAIGTLLALYSAKMTEKGQLVDISMYDGLVSMLGFVPNQVTKLNQHPTRTGNRTMNVFSTIFPSKDGYVIIAAITDKLWRSFCKIIGREEWASETSPFRTTNGRLENYDELEALITDWTRKKTTKEIVSLLEQVNIPCGPVNSISDVLNDPHLIEREMFPQLEIPEIGKVTVPGVAVKLKGTPSRSPMNPPELGEHTVDILREAGYTDDSIQNLQSQGIIAI